MALREGGCSALQVCGQAAQLSNEQTLLPPTSPPAREHGTGRPGGQSIPGLQELHTAHTKAGLQIFILKMRTN